MVNDTVSEAFLKRELKRAEQERVTLTCTDTNPGEETPCFICDACDKSPLFEKKEAMLAAPLNGLARDMKYAKNWTFPASATAAAGE